MYKKLIISIDYRQFLLFLFSRTQYNVSRDMLQMKIKGS